MSEQFIKLGPIIITQELEKIFNNTIKSFSFDSFFKSIKDQKKILGLFLYSRGFPTFYIYISNKGPFLTGLTGIKDTPKKALIRRSASVPQEFGEEYKAIFKCIHVPLPEEDSLKLFIGMFNEALPIPSFAVLGKKEETVEILNREGVYGEKLLSAASMFSEEKFIKILNGYERWNEEKYRFDFEKEKALFSIKLSKTSTNTESEDRAISAMINQMISKSYQKMFIYVPGGLINGVPNVLTTFHIRFESLPKFLTTINAFIAKFNKSTQEIDDILEDILLQQMDFLK